jgi:hypothetical protein
MPLAVSALFRANRRILFEIDEVIDDTKTKPQQQKNTVPINATTYFTSTCVINACMILKQLHQYTKHI